MPSEADMVVVNDDKLNLAAANSDDLFTRFIAQNNVVMAADNFLNGADVYGATSLRCLFQFYFCLRLPNGYDHPKIEDNALAAVLGWVGATALIGFIGWTGYQFNKDQKQLWIEKQFTDEFLLTYYVLGYDSANDKRDKVLENNLVEIRRLISALSKKDSDFQKRNDLICDKATGEANRAAILDILAKEYPDQRQDNPTIGRTRWKNTYDYIVHFAYAQWLFWMATTIVLCQAIDGYTTDNEDLSGAFTKELVGHEGLLYVQAVIGFVVATAILLLKKHPSENEIANENKMKNQQEALRKWWLTPKETHGDITVKITKEYIEENISEFNKAIGYSRALSVTNSFISNFLLIHIAIWPVAVFFREGFHVDSELAEEYVTVFLLSVAFATLCATIKYRDLTQENEACKVIIRSGYCPKSKTSAENNLLTFWFKNSEHTHKFIYIVIGGILGSGGFLLTRTLFSGGIGNVDFGELFKGHLTDSKDLMKHGCFDDPLFLIGVCATVLMIGLQMCEYYKNMQRKEILSDANDYKLKNN